MHYIYTIQNKLNDKIYVGQTKNIKRRWNQHKYDAKKFNYPLYNAMNKYGVDNFIIQDIEEWQTIEDINDAEEFWIQFFQSRNREFGYNLKSGGNVTHHSPETIAKISSSQKGRKKSPEQIEKVASKLRGRKLSEAHKQAISKGNLIAQQNSELKELHRQTWLGKNNPNYGRVYSEEDKIRLAYRKQEYDLISPDGKEIHVINLKDFCRQNNIRYDSMFRVVSGIRPHHKGWKIK